SLGRHSAPLDQHVQREGAHMVAAHEDHQLGQAEASARLEAATRNIDDATDHASNSRRSLSPAENDRAVKRRGTLQKLWAPTQRDISVYTLVDQFGASLQHGCE
ncbi:hypothetical protein L914_04300, partial [Phytophthora nicotianae]